MIWLCNRSQEIRRKPCLVRTAAWRVMEAEEKKAVAFIDALAYTPMPTVNEFRERITETAPCLVAVKQMLGERCSRD